MAAAFALLALAAVPWATLCLGEDGHIAFEVVVDGRCLDGDNMEPSSEHAMHLSDCTRDAGCGPCTDIRGTADVWLASASSDLPDAPPPFVSVAHAAIPQPAPVAPSLRLEFVATTTRRAETATTILRC